MSCEEEKNNESKEDKTYRFVSCALCRNLVSDAFL